MLRRTKIVATLGPSTDSGNPSQRLSGRVSTPPGSISPMAAPRNISIGQPGSGEAAAAQDRFVAVMADLQGPKLRISRFRDHKVTLVTGQDFVLDAAMDKEAGTEERVGIDYEQLIDDVAPGDVLVLDDGRIEMEVTSVGEHSISSQVLNGGVLSDNKGLNKRGGGLSADALTDKDREDIVTAARLGADYVAVSFVRTAEGSAHGPSPAP